jgi:hypothetical protein
MNYSHEMDSEQVRNTFRTLHKIKESVDSISDVVDRSERNESSIRFDEMKKLIDRLTDTIHVLILKNKESLPLCEKLIDSSDRRGRS